MKVNIHGNSFSDETCVEDFVCEKCGCEFSAIEDEYYIDYGGADVNVSLASIRAFITDYIVCSCPECHKIIKKERKRRNELLTEISPFTVTTLDSDDNVVMHEDGESVSTGEI